MKLPENLGIIIDKDSAIFDKKFLKNIEEAGHWNSKKSLAEKYRRQKIVVTTSDGSREARGVSYTFTEAKWVGWWGKNKYKLQFKKEKKA